MNVHLHIERLVVEGVDVPNRAALQAAVQTELARLIGEQGIANAPHIGHVPRATAPAIHVGGATQLGASIATAVHRSVGGGGGRS